jgi:hypothetical protein
MGCKSSLLVDADRSIQPIFGLFGLKRPKFSANQKEIKPIADDMVHRLKGVT